jgi:penicillin-binding protein 2
VRDPVPGLNLYLGIDLRLQRVMHDTLKAKMEEVKAPWAVAVAMNPQNGQILGMVSLPSYDNNIFAENIDEDYLALEKDERRPLINYAVGGLYPPGSTFKLITSAAALAEGVITADTKIVDSGPIFLKNRYFPDDLSQAQKFVSWNHKLGITHGPLDVVQALALSNDIFFYYLGGGFPDEFEGLGQKRLGKWMELFGYGETTGSICRGRWRHKCPPTNGNASFLPRHGRRVIATTWQSARVMCWQRHCRCCSRRRSWPMAAPSMSRASCTI